MKKPMTKGRKKTWKERIDIVLFCLKNDFESTKAAEKYEVLYQQVYLWVKKYKAHGVDALKDRRGRKKKRYVKSTPQHVAENILNREFNAEEVNQKWVTDVTEFKYGNSKAYLSAILDLHDNSIVSYVLGHSN
jgi:transposase InsO family protein